MPGKILVVGSLNMDLVGCAPRLPVVGETIVGSKYFDEPGGKGANQAYTAARLAGHVAMLGRVGSDDFGRRMRANLERAGCDVSGILTVPDCTSGIALIFVADTGQNSIIIVPGANGRLLPDDVRAAESNFAGVTIVMLQLENPLGTVIEAARMARRAGARVILDPAPARPLSDEVFPLVEVMTPNETEAAILAGLQPQRLDPDEAAAIGRDLQRRGAGAVVMKLGEQGCVLVTADGTRHLPAPKVKAVDTTAAGDVFNAGLAVAMSEGKDLVAACQYANIAAAISVTRIGTQIAAPDRAEVDAFAAN